MYNNNYTNGAMVPTWNEEFASKAKTGSLIVLALLALNFLRSFIPALIMSEAEYQEKFLPNFAPGVTATATSKWAFVVISLIVAAIFIGLVYAKYSKLNNMLVPGRGIFMFLLIVNIIALVAGIFALVNGTSKGGILDIISLIGTAAMIYGAYTAYSNIGKLKDLIFGANARAFNNVNAPVNNPTSYNNENLPNNLNNNVRGNLDDIKVQEVDTDNRK